MRCRAPRVASRNSRHVHQVRQQFLKRPPSKLTPANRRSALPEESVAQSKSPFTGGPNGMERTCVHFELFVRRHARAPWTLALVTEDRGAAFEAAHDAINGDETAAVRLCKETRDPATGDFRPLT